MRVTGCCRNEILRKLWKKVIEMLDLFGTDNVAGVLLDVGGDFMAQRDVNKNSKEVPEQSGVYTEPSDAIDRKGNGRFAFLIPVIVLLIGALTYFIILPHIYGKVVFCSNDIFAGPENDIDIIQNSDAVFPELDSNIGIRIFWDVWWTGFIASLFFAGKKLHTKPAPDNSNSILKKREPYLMIQGVSEKLKCVNRRRNSKELDALVYAIKCLEEKLSVESDFGYGNSRIINCENNIARQLQFLVVAVLNVENGNFTENVRKLNATVVSINSLLRRRSELKKR